MRVQESRVAFYSEEWGEERDYTNRGLCRGRMRSSLPSNSVLPPSLRSPPPLSVSLHGRFHSRASPVFHFFLPRPAGPDGTRTRGGGGDNLSSSRLTIKYHADTNRAGNPCVSVNRITRQLRAGFHSAERLENSLRSWQAIRTGSKLCIQQAGTLCEPAKRRSSEIHGVNFRGVPIH